MAAHEMEVTTKKRTLAFNVCWKSLWIVSDVLWNCLTNLMVPPTTVGAISIPVPKSIET